MLKSLFIFSFLLLGAPVFYSCIDFNFGDSAQGSEYIMESFEISTGRFTAVNGLYTLASVDFSTDTLIFSDFAIQIAAEPRYLSSNNSHFIYSLWSSANAEPPVNFTSSSIDLLTITSSKDIIIDERIFTTGSNISSLFKASFGRIGLAPSPILELIQDDLWQIGNQLFLFFIAEPDQPIIQEFQIEMIMNDGNIYDLQTELVAFQ